MKLWFNPTESLLLLPLALMFLTSRAVVWREAFGRLARQVHADLSESSDSPQTPPKRPPPEPRPPASASIQRAAASTPPWPARAFGLAARCPRRRLGLGSPGPRGLLERPDFLPAEGRIKRPLRASTVRGNMAFLTSSRSPSSDVQRDNGKHNDGGDMQDAARGKLGEGQRGVGRALRAQHRHCKESSSLHDQRQ